MKDQLEAVARFHKAFGLGKAAMPTVNLEREKVLLRHRLMAEENAEYLEAALAGDLEEVADALGDMLYILCGTILEHGMHEVIEQVFAEIQESNMSKLGTDGRPVYREDGKVLKGPGYRTPDIKRVLENFLSEKQQ
ncbi:pyrophosphohydrolase domain-containing protein [Robertkochia sediminum]|uniref:nucleoside triphosphate pyrophosphohydrolase family protein n=1 Tax=Robertkochia sediminum TaxID=2785326 RepID=UPI0019349EC6|nr:nucleoside triphosphate pyrophosphohydrolase family protein [Robertkochia sediminum]MBL7472281.1 nucleoside triphosphate pyrophosphohydrolase family protein [Robertkochia sediminum]